MAATAAGQAAFAAWLHDRLVARGYDLSGERSGGKSAAAADAGISRSSMSRLLNAVPVTDIDVYRRLAKWLDRPLGDILVRVEKMTPADLTAVSDPPELTPERAADEWGITDPAARQAFTAMVEVLRRVPPDPGSGT